MAQHTGRQYDDDLTVGADEYKESFSTDYVDLFEPLGDDDAPIAKLKTIILSIDWEITDDILQQLNDELQDLKDVWAGNKINLIYLQALEKIGRYISSEKANSHPNAIKLLLTFYSDLEKIVSSTTMSEEEKKKLLLQDVKKFDQFKIQITPPVPQEKKIEAVGSLAAESQRVAPAVEVPSPVSRGQKNVLTNLKAIVLGIDWEISDKELVRLNDEVNKLEQIFSESRAKLIFLQGLGALGNYIRSTKSNAHPNAFKLLHSFYNGLERIYNEVLSKEQEKEILLAEVTKFNAFKAVIAKVASEVVVPVDDSSLSAEKEVADEEELEEESGTFTPAFADMPEDVHGFRADSEVVKNEIDKGVASFLGEEVLVDQSAKVARETTSLAPEGPEVKSRLDELFGEEEEFELLGPVPDIALEGVNVETEADDDSEEKALPLQSGELAPALAEAGEQGLFTEETFVDNPPTKEIFVTAPLIPGVDVETEADDESEEAALPRDQGEVAPALMFTDEEYGFREAELTNAPDEDEFDLEDRLDSFFGAEIEEASLESSVQVSDDVPEKLVSAELTPEAPSAAEIEEIAPADLEEQEVSVLEPVAEIPEVEEAASDLVFEGVGVAIPADAKGEDIEVIFEPVGDEVEVDELPDITARIATEADLRLEQESLAGLQKCVASILLKEYETAFPSFFAETNKLRQGWQGQYLKNTFLQLLLTVAQYIDTNRGGADAESLTLLQSLSDKLELVCLRQTGLDGRREQVLFEGTCNVLRWQQGLISAVLAKEGRETYSSKIVDDLDDLFSEE
ncbi:MAG: hypothetical protein KJ990_13500 [Proteobacteria bacterium]|nr:hypothetical protein [Pseudomonadota bacterium]MBU1648300.1 hypothetical protein [Pseudomonadota bacterium]MBU1986758.1 hypothetical protein [Pseudomonadota bacterium]